MKMTFPHSWHVLKCEADRLGLRIFAKLPGIQDIQEDIRTLHEEAEALAALQDTDEGLSDDQERRWAEIMDEDGGELTKAHERLAAAKRLEGQRKRLASLELAERGPADNPLRGTEYDRQSGSLNQAQLIAIESHRSKLIRSGRLRAFGNSEAAKADAFNAGCWLLAQVGRATQRPVAWAEKHLEKIGWNPQATATEGSASGGGYTVPDPLTAAFIEYRERVSVMRQLADRYAMTADTLRVPKLVSGQTVYYPAEGSAGTASDTVWGQIQLTAVKRMVISKVSKELQADSLINFIDRVVSRAAYQIAYQEDNEAINGDGTSTYGGETGILAALGAASKYTAPTGDDTWPELALDDFTGTMALLPDEHWMNPVWICSSAFYHGVMLRVQAAAGGNTIATLEAGGQARPMFLGYPVYFTGRMPKTTAVSQTSALFGTPQEAIALGDRQAVEVDITDQRYWDEDNYGVKVTDRIDWNAHNCGDGSDAGALVGLVTAAS